MVLEYEIGFLQWAKHIPIPYPSQHDIVYVFISGLALPLYLASKHLIADRSFFCQVVDKRPCHYYSAISIPFGSMGPSRKGELYL